MYMFLIHLGYLIKHLVLVTQSIHVVHPVQSFIQLTVQTTKDPAPNPTPPHPTHPLSWGQNRIRISKSVYDLYILSRLIILGVYWSQLPRSCRHSNHLEKVYEPVSHKSYVTKSFVTAHNKVKYFWREAMLFNVFEALSTTNKVSLVASYSI